MEGALEGNLSASSSSTRIHRTYRVMNNNNVGGTDGRTKSGMYTCPETLGIFFLLYQCTYQIYRGPSSTGFHYKIGLY